jgi:hypothetical protein
MVLSVFLNRDRSKIIYAVVISNMVDVIYDWRPFPVNVKPGKTMCHVDHLVDFDNPIARL